MSEKRFLLDKLEKGNAILSVRITDNVTDDNYFIMTKEAYEDDIDEIVDCLNEQQATIEKQKRIIKSQDAEISRQYNLCLAMSGVLREEFGVYDVFDRTKDKKEDN